MKKGTNLGFVLFISAYILCMLDAVLFGYSTYAELQYSQIISNCLRIAAATLILIKLCTDRFYPLRTFVLMAFAGAVLLISFIKSGYSHIFYLMIVLIGVRGIDINKTLRIDFCVRLVLVLFVVLSGVLVIENYVTQRTGSDVLRISAGFNHPNTLAALVMSLIFEDALINERRSSALYTLSVWLIAATVVWLTANRTSVILMFLFPVLLFIVQNQGRDYIGRGWRVFGTWLCPAVAVFSYVEVLMCRRNRLFAAIDAFASNRFYNCRKLLDMYGIPLLGQKVKLVSVKTARQLKSGIALLDVSYIRTLIQAGPVVLLMIILLYMNAIYRACRDNDRLLVLVFGLFIIFGLFESGFNNVYMNFAVLLAASAAYKRQNATEE